MTQCCQLPVLHKDVAVDITRPEGEETHLMHALIQQPFNFIHAFAQPDPLGSSCLLLVLMLCVGSCLWQGSIPDSLGTCERACHWRLAAFCCQYCIRRAIVIRFACIRPLRGVRLAAWPAFLLAVFGVGIRALGGSRVSISLKGKAGKWGWSDFSLLLAKVMEAR